ARCREPDPAPEPSEAGRPEPARALPRARPAARAGRDPALERPTRRPHDQRPVRAVPGRELHDQQLDRVRVTRIARIACLVALLPLLSSCSLASVIRTEASCTADSASFAVLQAQAVPSATLLPCIGTLSTGWTYAGSDVVNGDSTFWLDSDRAGIHAVEVSLTPSCSTAGMNDVTQDTDERRPNLEVFPRP